MVFRKETYRVVSRSVRRATLKYSVNEPPRTVYTDQVYPQLPFLIRAKKYNMKYSKDNTPGGQLYNLGFAVTHLFRDERIILSYNKATEIRPHVEMLIIEAMRNGDRHKQTMALANFWLREKNLIHKLFKVFVPRYLNHASAFTSLHMLGTDYDYSKRVGTCRFLKEEAVLEMKGNILPPIVRPKLELSGLLNNILIDGAREKSSLKKQESKDNFRKLEILRHLEDKRRPLFKD